LPFIGQAFESLNGQRMVAITGQALADSRAAKSWSFVDLIQIRNLLISFVIAAVAEW